MLGFKHVFEKQKLIKILLEIILKIFNELMELFKIKFQIQLKIKRA